MSQSFSFTCVICIEQFDKEERYPVVLPCGHTYLCHQCAQRLDRCTECRAPLMEEIPQPSQVPSSCRNHTRASQPSNFRMSQMYGGSSSRSLSSVPRDFNRQGTSPQVDSPQPQVLKKRLPLPKNLVLLSLMEAESSTIPSTSESEDRPVNSKVLPDALSKEEDKVNSCGSYIVKALEGLQVVPIKPTDTPLNDANENLKDNDSLVSTFYVDYGQLLEAEETDNNFLPPDLLQYGDTVQVIWIDKDGWAKLARGYGYVQAGNGDLVKVGEPKDVTCKLEEMIHSIATEKRQVLSKLTREKNKFDDEHEVIAKKLRRALIETEDQTVVTNEEGSTSNVVQVLTFEDSVSSFIEVFDTEDNRDWHDSKPEILRFYESTGSISVMDSDIESDTDTDAGNAVEDLQQETESQVFRPLASSPCNASQSLSRCNADDESESVDAKELPAPSTPKRQIVDSNIRCVDFRGLSSHSGFHSARIVRRSPLSRSTSDNYRNAVSYSSLSNHSALSRTRTSGRQPRRFSGHF